MIRKWIALILLIILPTFVGSNILPEREILRYKVKPVEVVKIDPLQGYYDQLGMMESSNNYKVVNRFGYMGKYQFGKKTLRGLRRTGDLEITNEQIKNFTDYPELQERAIRALTRHNLRILARYGLQERVGTVFMGVKITQEGMLAAAHLCGPYSVKQLFRSKGKIMKEDGNKVTILDYMKKFQYA